LLDSEEGAALNAFTSRLIALRKQYEVLRSEVFLYGQDSPGQGINDVEWWDERGEQLSPEDWHNPEGRALSMRRALRREDGCVEAINLLLNASDDPVHFTLTTQAADRWVLIDSSRPDLADDEQIGSEYELAAHSAALIRSVSEFAQ
jgi:isoamylase